MSKPAHAQRAGRGRLGESLAAQFLESRGYAILARNYRAGRLELDLIAERGELLVAVEVKWRRRGRFDDAAGEAWRRPQRARMHAAVLAAMAIIPDSARRPWRLDLIAIEESAEGWQLIHRPGAWSPGDSSW